MLEQSCSLPPVPCLCLPTALSTALPAAALPPALRIGLPASPRCRRAQAVWRGGGTGWGVAALKRRSTLSNLPLTHLFSAAGASPSALDTKSSVSPSTHTPEGAPPSLSGHGPCSTCGLPVIKIAPMTSAFG